MGGYLIINFYRAWCSTKIACFDVGSRLVIVPARMIIREPFRGWKRWIPKLKEVEMEALVYILESTGAEKEFKAWWSKPLLYSFESKYQQGRQKMLQK